MKKQLLTLLGVTLLCSGMFAQAKNIGQANQALKVTGVPGQKLSHNWDTKSSQFVIVGRNLYTYDLNKKAIADLQQDSAKGFFVNKNKTEIFYNPVKTDLPDSNVAYTWNKPMSKWDRSLKYVAKYTAFDGPDLYEIYFGAVLYITIDYSYDGNNHILYAVSQQLGENSDSTHFTNDGNGNPISNNAFKWNKGNKVWDKDRITTSTYDGNNNQLTSVRKDWSSSNSAYLNNDSTVYTYDSNNNQNLSIRYVYKSSAWTPLTRVTTFYKNGTEYDYQLVESWNGSKYESVNKYVWDDKIATGISTAFAKTSVFTVFPNPSSANANILFTTAAPETVKVTVLDATGKQVMVIADEVMSSGVHTVSANTSGLAKGLYFINLQNGQTISTQTLIVE